MLEPQEDGQTFAAEAFNFSSAVKNGRPANVGARAEVVLATLYNQLFRKTGTGRNSKSDPQLPLFRPPATQPDAASREAHYYVHAYVACKLEYPDSYAARIVEQGAKLDPEAVALWRRVPPPPPLSSLK